MSPDSPSEGNTAAGELALRVFGPLADSLGVELGKLPGTAVRNLARLAEVFSRKNRRPPSDRVLSSRLFHQIADEAMWSEDEIVAEYLGGVLASSGSGPANDRGVGITALVRRLSATQLRAHYIFYSELLRLALPGRATNELDLRWSRNRHPFHVELPLEGFLHRIDPTYSGLSQGDIRDLVSHVVMGLAREFLIDESSWDYVVDPAEDPRHRPPHVAVHPSPLGAELFLWGCGSPITDQSRLFNPALEIVISDAFPPIVGSKLGNDVEMLASRLDEADALLEDEDLDALEALASSLAAEAPDNAAGYFYLSVVRELQVRHADARSVMRESSIRATNDQRKNGFTTLGSLMIHHPSMFEDLLALARILEAPHSSAQPVTEIS